MKKYFFLLFVVVFTGCGGGSLPHNLRVHRVIIDKLYPQHTVLLQKKSLGLIERIFYYKKLDVFAAVGHLESCIFDEFGKIQAVGKNLSELNLIPKIIETKIGTKFDLSGDIFRKWLFSFKDGFSVRNYRGTCLGSFKPPTDYWYKAAVSSSEPNLIFVSTDRKLFALSNELKKIIDLHTPEIIAPLHVLDGAILNIKNKKLIVSLYTGRGGWHRSILFIHDMEGRILYHEILNRHKSIMPLNIKNKSGFMLGGRGCIRLYLL